MGGDLFPECPICEGYEVKGGCGFCKGEGMFQIQGDSYTGFMEGADRYRAFISTGGKPEDWED